jgi:hypothetical protein
MMFPVGFQSLLLVFTLVCIMDNLSDKLYTSTVIYAIPLADSLSTIFSILFDCKFLQHSVYLVSFLY